MDTRWLEDFVSLAETGSFSRSALARHVTQPAFSRRIQALEAWLGVDLVDRSAYPTRLTPAGEVFRERAEALLAQLQEARMLVRDHVPSAHRVLDIATTHTLSLTFMPKWLEALQGVLGRMDVKLRTGNVHDAAMALSEGASDLLVCYHHARYPLSLASPRYEALRIGTEWMEPFSRPDEAGRPLHTLPGTADQPTPYLSYTRDAYFGRMADLILEQASEPAHLDKRYETDMAEALKMMAIEGHGVAFLPLSAVSRELEAGRLVPASPGHRAEIEIRIYRDRSGTAGGGRPDLEALWAHLATLGI